MVVPALAANATDLLQSVVTNGAVTEPFLAPSAHVQIEHHFRLALVADNRRLCTIDATSDGGITAEAGPVGEVGEITSHTLLALHGLACGVTGLAMVQPTRACLALVGVEHHSFVTFLALH